jgi:hypothetical protein
MELLAASDTENEEEEETKEILAKLTEENEMLKKILEVVRG